MGKKASRANEAQANDLTRSYNFINLTFVILNSFEKRRKINIVASFIKIIGAINLLFEFVK